jgi:hypothetical protein
MKKVRGILFAVSIVASGLNCPAQGTSVPFLQIERDAQSHTQTRMASSDSAGSFSSGVTPTASSVSRFVSSSSPVSLRTFDKRYFFVNGLHLGTAMLDVALTQRCIANHTCSEANPLMPSSAAGQVGVDCALVGYTSWVSYRLKKHHSSLWWISPTMGTAAHAVGAGTGIAHF